MATPRAVIFGCAGYQLTREERELFARTRPFGLILFARNIRDPLQVMNLTAEFRACVGRADAPVLIDQEGGRVARLRPPHWTEMPSAETLGRLFSQDSTSGIAAAKLMGRLLAWQLKPLGISINCAPVADLRIKGADDVIGNRAFSADPEVVGKLARAVADGLMAGGVIPVVKHLPGHGRAAHDTHKQPAIVTTALDELLKTDFVAFQTLRDLPLGMTAHVTYTAIDPAYAASLSPAVIKLIRKQLKFRGLLMSDDITMKALSGSVAEVAAQVLAAGCDLALYCKHDVDEMRAIAAAVPLLSPAAREAWQNAQTGLKKVSKPFKLFDPPIVEAEFRRLLSYVLR